MALNFLNNGYFAGKVGIGNDSPGTKLHVGTGSGATVDTGYQMVLDSAGIAGLQILSATNQSGRIVFGDSGDNDIGMIKYDHTDNSMGFRTNGSGSERMRISSTGNVGIGTSTPSAKLDVQGSLGQLFSVTDDLSGEIFAVADISGVPIMSINSSGVSYFDNKVGIGTSTPSRGDLVVKGDFQTIASGNGQLAIISKISGSNPSAADVGGQMVFGGPISTSDSNRTFGLVGGYKENTTSSNRAGYLSFGTRQDTGTRDIFERIRVSSVGAIKFNNYNSTNNTGTPTYLLGTDASGNVIKTLSTPGGDPGPYLPLAGGTMDSAATITTSGTLSIVGSSAVKLRVSGGARIQVENANASDSFYISNTGGNLASTLDLGGTLSIIEGGASTFTGSITTQKADNVLLVESTNAGQASLDLKNTEGHYRIITDAGEFKIFDQTDSRLPFLIDTSGNATFAGDAVGGTGADFIWNMEVWHERQLETKSLLSAGE